MFFVIILVSCRTTVVNCFCKCLDTNKLHSSLVHKTSMFSSHIIYIIPAKVFLCLLLHSLNSSVHPSISILQSGSVF